MCLCVHNTPRYKNSVTTQTSIHSSYYQLLGHVRKRDVAKNLALYAGLFLQYNIKHEDTAKTKIVQLLMSVHGLHIWDYAIFVSTCSRLYYKLYNFLEREWARIGHQNHQSEQDSIFVATVQLGGKLDSKKEDPPFHPEQKQLWIQPFRFFSRV